MFVVFILIIVVTAFTWSALKKSTNRKAKILFWTIVGIFVIGGIAFIGIVISFIHFLSPPPPPPTPEITHGSFPFRLEYEIDGERFVIEDTLIAEYIRSRAVNWIDPAYRIWRTCFLDGSWIYEESWHRGSTRIKETNEVIIRFHSGHASYFMDDWTYGWHGARYERSNYRFWFPAISFDFYDEDIENFAQEMNYAADILYEHGIILIDWWYTPPIESE